MFHYCLLVRSTVCTNLVALTHNYMFFGDISLSKGDCLQVVFFWSQLTVGYEDHQYILKKSCLC